QLVSLPPAFRQRVSLQRVFVLRCAGLRLRERVALPVRAPVALLPPASVLLHEQVALPVRVRVVLLLPVPVALRVRVRRPRAARLPSALSLPSLPSLAALSVAGGAQPPAAVPLVSACARLPPLPGASLLLHVAVLRARAAASLPRHARMSC